MAPLSRLGLISNCGSRSRTQTYLRNTVSLVHSHEANASGNILDVLDETLIVQSLGGTIQNSKLSIAQSESDLLNLFVSLCGVDAVGCNAAFL